MGKGTQRLLNSARIEVLENPIDFMAEDHMREREVCAMIDMLVSNTALKDADIYQMLAFLEDQLPQHLADEEHDLFPLMLKRCEPDDEIERVIVKLQSDHTHAISDAPAIALLIKGNRPGDAPFSDTACAQLREFATHARRHLILENAIVLPIARARLTKDDLKTMRSHMLERRGLDRRPMGEKC